MVDSFESKARRGKPGLMFPAHGEMRRMPPINPMELKTWTSGSDVLIVFRVHAHQL
jgi:hypothetical protein